MKVNHDIKALRAEPSRELDVAHNPRHATRPFGDDHLVDMPIPPDNRCRRGFHQVSYPRVRKALPHGCHGRRCQNDIANQTEADEQDLQGSTVASSMSMTGMSSLIG